MGINIAKVLLMTHKGRKIVAIAPVEDLKFIEELEDKIDLQDAMEALKGPGLIHWNKKRPQIVIGILHGQIQACRLLSTRQAAAVDQNRVAPEPPLQFRLER